MELACFVVGRYLELAALAVLAWVVGRGALRGFPFDSSLEKLVFSSGIGAGIVATTVFMLGCAGQIRPVPVGVALAGLLLAGLAMGRAAGNPTGQAPEPGRGNPPAGLPWIAWAMLAGGLGWLLWPLMRLPLYPPVEWDATSFHLPVARAFARTHGIGPLPWVRYPAFPAVQESLFSLGMLFSRDVFAQLTQLWMTLLTGVALLAWGRREGSWRTGGLAAALWLGASMVVELGVIAYVDAGLACFAALACYAFSNWRRDRNGRWLALCGCFAGLAASSKYSGLILAVSLGGAVLASSRRPGPALRFASIASLVALPWYARIGWFTGSPVFPFLSGIFPNRLWAPVDLARQMADLGSHDVTRTFQGAVTALAHLALRHGDLVIHPLNVPSMVLAVALGVMIGFAFLLDRSGRPLALVVLAYLVPWFLSAPHGRYLMPILPAVILLKSRWVDAWLRRLPFPRANALAGGLVGLAGFLLLRDGGIHAAGIVRIRGEIPVNAAQRSTHLARELPTGSYPAYTLLNERCGTSYTVYGLYAENMVAICNGTHIGDWFGPGRFSDVEQRLGNGEDLYRHLRGLGAGYFLIDLKRLRQPLPSGPEFDRHFAQILKRSGCVAYELRTAVPRELGARPEHRLNAWDMGPSAGVAIAHDPADGAQ